MAAPAGSEPRLCDKCFFALPPDANSCPECGAPVGDNAEALESSNAQIYPELARANLLRMRGEYRQAEDVCLAILRRFPNNATANTLLGDICAERGDLEQAAEWYELALDILPNAEAERQKLERVRQRLKEREAASTAQQLGLPSARPRVGLYVASILILVALVGGASYLIGRQTLAQRTPAEGGVVNVPVSMGDPGVGSPNRVESQTGPNASTPADVRMGDPDLLAAIATKFTDGRKLIGAWKDPRTGQIFLTLALGEGDNERQLAAMSGRAALEHVGDAPRATIRALKDGAEHYVADVTREALVIVQGEAWQAAHRDDLAALADALLSNEWTREKGLILPRDPATSAGSGVNPDTPVSSPPDPGASADPGQPRSDGGAPPTNG